MLKYLTIIRVSKDNKDLKMINLKTRLNVTSQELAEIRETALSIQDKEVAKRESSVTFDDIFEMVLNDEQFKAYKSNAMTKSLCADLLKF